MKKKIFIIEDNRILLSYVEKSFVMAGYPVATANTGLLAVEKLSEQSADVIFMDYFLPNLNADRLCRILRRMGHLQGAYIVVMSAAATELQADFKAMGADALIAKGSFKDTAKLMIRIVEDIEAGRQGEVAGLISGSDKVSPRQMTKELLAQNRHLQAMLDSIVEGILEVQSERVVYANPAAEKLLGRSQDQLLAARWTDLLDQQGNPLVSHMLAPEDRDALGREYHHTVTIGDRVLRIRRIAIKKEQEDALLLVADETEQRQARQVLQEHQRNLEKLVQERTVELERANERLRHTQKMEAMGTIASGVAHDLNNILSGLVSYPDLLLMELPEHSPLRQPVMTIKRSGEKAAAIVQDLLSLARRGTGTHEPVNLNDIITNYLNGNDYMQLQAHHHAVRVEPRLTPNPPSIKGSPAELYNVVMNLVTNAAEAVSATGPIVIATDNRRLDQAKRGYEDIPAGQYVILSVADKGLGLSAYDLQRIFEPFYTRKALGRSGTGLGLAVVWGVVHDHFGYIDVASGEGQGTAFSLYFPAVGQP